MRLRRKYGLGMAPSPLLSLTAARSAGGGGGASSAAVLSGVAFDGNGDLAGSIDQHGYLYIITSAESTRTAPQIKAGTGAEDAFDFFVNAGVFDFVLALENTTGEVERFMHIVLENDNGFSNVVTLPFTIIDFFKLVYLAPTKAVFRLVQSPPEYVVDETFATSVVLERVVP